MYNEFISNWKEDGLPTVITNNSITVTLPNLKTITVNKNDGRFLSLRQSISNRDWENVIMIIDNKVAIQKISDGRFTVNDKDQVLINNKILPESLSKRLLASVEMNLPIENLLNFWDNLNQNPSKHSVHELHNFLEKNALPITPDGCFIAFRKVRDDFKDSHSGTMDNSPGKTVRMDRNEVDDNPSRGCSTGLHVANEKYAKGFNGTRMIMCKVNPKNVVTVPNDYDNEKMRVCEFHVLAEIDDDGMKDIQMSPLYDDGSTDVGDSSPSILVAADDNPLLNGQTVDDDGYENY